MENILTRNLISEFFALCSDGIACFNSSGSIVYFNNSFLQCSGFSADTLKGMSIKQLLPHNYNELLSGSDEKRYTEIKFVTSSGLKIIPALVGKQSNGQTDSISFLILNSGIKPAIIKELSVINNCLKNLKQDLGGDIGTCDYLNLASESSGRIEKILNNGAGR